MDWTQSFELEIIISAIWIFGFLFMAIIFAPSSKNEELVEEDNKKLQELPLEQDLVA